jgi:sulfatase modifying factor 1
MAETRSYHELTLVPVPGMSGIRDFHIGSTPVTQAFWMRVMDSTPAPPDRLRHPAHASWDDLTRSGGFLDRLNGLGLAPGLTFRLPTEAEWEYAARGGPQSADGFIYSGSNDIDAVAWYAFRFSAPLRVASALLGWRLVGRLPRWRKTHTHDVGLKAPNQLGLYDMTGNVWEWCQDACGDGERRLRGGCHHNWDIHCTNAFRYSQPSDAKGDGIGFRLVLA